MIDSHANQKFRSDRKGLSMTTEHDPYACPICLGIGEVARRFPTAIRLLFVTIGTALGAVVAGSLLAIFTGALAGLLAAEIIGAVVVHVVRGWLRRRMAKLDDPAWREPRDRYLAEMHQRQRRNDSLFELRRNVNPVHYPLRR